MQKLLVRVLKSQKSTTALIPVACRLNGKF